MADLKDVLSTIDSALSVVKGIADTPGINLIPYVSTISSAISALHTAYTVGQDIVPYITAIKDTFTPGAPAPSMDDLTALNAKIAALEAKVQAPLPPKEDGEPE